MRSRGNVPAALLSGVYGGVVIDAAQVERSSLELAGAPDLGIGGGAEDLDADGDLDVVFHFATQELDLTPASSMVCLSGVTAAGVHFEGCDEIRVVPR